MMKEGEQAQRRLWHRKNEYDVTIYCMDEPQKRTYVPSYMRLLTPVELTPKSYKSSEYGNPRLEMKKILENAQKINEMAKQVSEQCFFSQDFSTLSMILFFMVLRMNKSRSS